MRFTPHALASDYLRAKQRGNTRAYGSLDAPPVTPNPSYASHMTASPSALRAMARIASTLRAAHPLNPYAGKLADRANAIVKRYRCHHSTVIVAPDSTTCLKCQAALPHE